MSAETKLPAIDRSHDISQPLEKLHPNERLKDQSNYLRGTIEQSLAAPLTGSVTSDDTKLMKFHGIYQQDDRDLREERRRQKLEPAYQFMVRVRLAGGVCSPRQWLKIDELSELYGGATLRMTTRQTFQFHGILKPNLRNTIQGLNEVLLDTIAACGDDTRGVMCSVNPHLSALHAEVYDLARRTSNRVIPKTRAYHEIWLNGEKVAASDADTPPEDPIYGRTYLPRKFKFGFVIPPVNDIDVYAQDVGLIAIAEGEKLLGFNLSVGGGMGNTDNAPETFPRLGDVVGYFPKEKLFDIAVATATIQRDYGDRVDRMHARFKYTIEDRGTDWFKAELASRVGFPLEEARPFEFTSNGDTYGWVQGSDGMWHFTMFIENGRIRNTPQRPLKTALRELALVHKGELRLTPNQNLIVANVSEAEKPHIADMLAAYGLDSSIHVSALRLNSMACVALPTCGLAMAESERYLPTLVTKVERILADHGLQDVPITMRMTGCPNGCARPYIAEIGFTGRAPGKYNFYLGGGFHGQRLNRLYLENVGEARILEELGKIIAHFAKDRHDKEHFGDFVIRAGYVRAVTGGNDFNS
ncbi:MAG TPA: NADPH-dependent assimilatory sulfite reductase hemoprotein subunit [Parvibaculum sp.]|uniref:NADPH-dependent assimilatory sulfite reductase hemoprotein subunit n=1 Tax=Parvibaculum sp. TaxID=2024848 RepID=UPI002C18FEAA|nr:NADPH-dependent assimilatory sulfite reductase hemoprotein subunit [Parvibaculum sp.]HMM14747.1 NADPH-dependent assimilatory sulfite reductase hemoprotein subunit [Parvibaculum sp.]